MSFATDKWFKHIRGELLTEGLADIGLDEMIQKEIEAALPEASEKGRMWVGAAWKSLDGNRISNYGWFEGYLINAVAKHIPTFKREDNNILLGLVNAYTTQPAGKWPKAKRKFAKNVLKFNFPDDAAKQVLIDFKVLEKRTWNWFSSRIENVIVTLNQNPNNYQLIKDIPPSDYQQAEKECFDFQKTQEDPDKIMHVFKDGSYWYDLDTYQCSMEGDRMGHCGRDERGTLYSLRKKEEGKKASKSYITIAYNAENETIYQIKGRQNSAPPSELWNHVAKFIEITGAERLEETGEYSNDVDGFEEMGQWLDNNTSISFEGSIEKRLEEFGEQVQYIENNWRGTDYFEQVDFNGVDVDVMEGFEGEMPRWFAGVNSVASKLPFDLTEKAIRALYAIGSDDPQDLKFADEIEEKVLELVTEEDRNDILSDAPSYQEPYAYLIKADSYAGAFQKADNMTRLMSGDREQFLQGSESYVVLADIENAFSEYVDRNLDVLEAEGFQEWCDAVDQLVDDLDDSLDAIENLLVSRALIKRPDHKGYIDKVEEEFNNFIVASSTKAKRGVIELFASGVLFKATEEQMQALKQVGFNQSLFRQENGSYWGYELRKEFLDTVFAHDRQAQAFAKNQMKLNFGEKYEQIPDDTFDKAFEIIEQGAQIGITTTPAGKGTPPSINYKITIIMDKNTFPVLGPYIEYYDNHFDVMIKGFQKGVRAEVKKAEEVYQQRTGSDTSLPVEEGLITEGLADIGLPDDLVGLIMEFLPEASEKGRVWVGNAFKVYAILGPARDRMLAELITLVDEHYKLFQFGDNPEANPFLNLDRALRTGNIKQVIKARKSFVKAASKLGVDQTITDKILRLVDRGLQGTLKFFLKERINSVVTTLNQNPNNYEMIKDFPDWDWSAANEAMEEYQSKIENPDQIIHRFDDGSYWYDLKTSRCKNEGERMGHCGTGMYGSLYSLRKKDKGKKESRSYVTISYNPEDKTIYQIKGRGNDAPLEQFWKHITEFVNLTGAVHNEELGQHSGNSKESFEKLARYLTQETGITSDLVDDSSLQEAGNPLDVRLYEIDYVMSYPLGQGFEITDIHNIIRAIPDVTTVRTIGNAKRSQGNRTLSLQRLKFALRGQKNRLEWVRQVLLPQIRKISPKIRIHKVDRAELISSSNQRLEESYYNSTMRQSPGRTTPLPSIQNLIDDWVEGGVMYDQPTNHNLTRYSVMMPVEDLKHLCGREPRKHGHHFDAGYQNFIQNGTRDPIYLAIGKNGRAKITGNEDDLRYAIKAGVEEVPVFISYQRQV